MIKDKKIKIKVSNRTLKHYISKGYKCKSKDIIKINVTDLPYQSTTKITAICDVCDKEKEIEYRKYINNFNNKNIFTCSEKCSYIKTKLTKIKNHDDENFNNVVKRKKTCKEKYNNENYINIEKRKKTNKLKYEFNTPSKNKNVRKKIINSYIEKYGVNHPMKNDKIKNKKLKSSYINGTYNNNIKKTLKTTKKNLLENINKYNVKSLDYHNKVYFCQCEEKEHIFETNFDLTYRRYQYDIKQCTICNPVNMRNSERETHLLNFIKENYDEEIFTNQRNIIPPHELDIYLPNINLAFEFNGLYWHNNLNKPNNYHLEKTENCKKHNIQLIHIWEDDWLYKQNIIKSMILNKLNKTPNKIYARKTEIKENFDNKLIRKFLEENHIQGFVGSKIKLGLFYNNELVSLMTFKSINLNNFELNRFCNKLNNNIVGGASKLFKYFINNYNPDSIISFSNNSYSNGDLYLKLNFKIDKILKPDYQYILNNKREHKFNFRKNRLKNEKIKENLTKIYDAGKIKFIYLGKTN